MGYVLGTQKEADVIIIIACSVRQKAVDRVWGKLRYWKRINSKAKIILTGCVLDQDKKRILEKVDCIIDSKKIDKELPKQLSAFNYQLSVLKGQTNQKRLKAESCKLKTSFVPIMFGCNNFCSYCAVPYTRGREVSRPQKEIIAEINELVKNGAKHITLLGQNVNSYQLKSKNAKVKTKSDFVILLKGIEKIDGVEKISFLTSHPKDMSNELIEWINNSPKFSGELHLPMQSGDNEILRKMNRNYTVEHYLKIIKKLSAFSHQLSARSCNLKANPPAGGRKLYLSTDVIVGFPDETEEQFKNTYKICKQIGFDKAYISQFSPRAGTPAAKMPDSVSPTEKKRRWEKLNNLINKKSC